MTAAENSKLDLIHDEVKEIKLLLNGNGSPEKGLIVRVDRVEQRLKIYRWVGMTVFAAIASAAALWVFKVL